ncbi:hypothetical protein LTR86_008970 [Recurvomyces mirabilis]|nr:hypothetical protein LTR86_008970 [Recurvomyces mirabilis]
MTTFIPTESVRFGKRLTEIHQDQHGVSLAFADGEVAHASVLAGADGIKSMVRKHVLEPSHLEEVAAVYADAYCYRAVISIAEAEAILEDLTGVAKFYFGKDRSAVTYRISGGEEFNFLLCVSDETGWKYPDAVTEKVKHEEMMADFQNHGVDQRFLCLLAKADPIRWGFFHHIRTSTYVNGRVALLGDSAHASLPFQAAGAGQGVEDALILSNVLAAMKDSGEQGMASQSHIQAALDAYDSIRRPRAQKQLEQSAEVARMIHFQDPETGSDMSKILAKLQNGRLDWLWFHDMEGEVQDALARMQDFLCPGEAETTSTRSADLIDGMTGVYKTFIAMGHPEDGDIHFPSTSTTPTHPEMTGRLMTAWFEGKAAKVVQNLSCLSQRMLDKHSHGGIPLAPDNHAISYTSAQLPSVEAMRSTCFSDDTIKTDESGGNIKTIPYDTHIINDIALDLPVKEELRKWEAKLRTLTWLPWTDNGNLTITPQPTEYERGLDLYNKDVDRILHERDTRVRAERDQFFAKRFIYEEAGWPETFNCEAVQQRRDEWNGRYTYRDLTDLRKHGPFLWREDGGCISKGTL